MTMSYLLTTTLQVIALLGFILLVVLALTYLERKVLGRIQMRMGPMRTGPWGILQAIADTMKLLAKEDLRPRAGDWLLFYLAPIVIFVPSFLVWVTIPFARQIVVRSLDLGLLYIVAVSTVSIVGMVLAGWSSGSKYSILGSARSAAQLISYELPIVFVIAGVGILAQSFNLVTIVEKQSTVPFALYQPLAFVIFLLAGLAEVGRIPFDIPQAESEVVGGPFVEYSGMRWSIFFVAEYANTFAISVLGALLFLGGWSGPFSDRFELLQPVWLFLKVSVLILVIFWIRATLPRLRIDQLMRFAWTVLLPLSFVHILFNATALFVQRYSLDASGVYALDAAGQVGLGFAQWLVLIVSTYAVLSQVEYYRTRHRQGVAS